MYSIVFADEYHNLNITQKLSVVQTGYHSTNDVVPTRDIASTLNNLTLATTVEQIHADHLMATIIQLRENSRILGGHIKQLV